jgi:hypothetical protein
MVKHHAKDSYMSDLRPFRVFAILAAAAGIGMVGVTQFMVRPHIKRIAHERDVSKHNWQQEESRANKLAAYLKDSETKLAAAHRSLDETQRQLAAASAMADQQKGLADTLQNDLDATKRKLNETQQDLAAWKALTIPVETMGQVIESEKRLRQENTVLRGELQILQAENRGRGNLVIACTFSNEPPPMPGVQGSILAVDPKWNFVVLDVGEKAGAKPRGVFMVSRGGKLIGKVKVATVQADRCIANVLPGWQFGELMEGDQVIF